MNPPGSRAPRRGLNILRPLREAMVRIKWHYYTRIWGMDIDPTANFSLKAHFDRTNPKGVHIGAETYVAFGAAILAHDMCRGLYADTRIGKRCFVGAHAIVLPGVTIGDECVVGCGSVVTRDLPPRSLAAGNPARIIRSNIKVVSRYGRYTISGEDPPSIAEERVSSLRGVTG